ncbi:MAG: hypothetical protein ABIO17_04590 [Pseudoxanthomonas sp.]
MKVWASSLLFVLPLLLTGCASTQKMAYRDTPAPSTKTIVNDVRYVALVETIAQRRGTHVVWINPPRKRVSSAAAATP